MRFRPNLFFSRAMLFSCVACALLCTGCTGFDLLNAPVSSVGYDRQVNIPYGEAPRQKLDVYTPRGAKPGAPVVIFLYGGEWQAGAKENYRFAGEALTSEGFIAVLPDYRLYPQVRFPAFVEDAAKAVRWAHDNIARFGGDPSRLYLMGHSAGAHIAALLTLDADYLKAVGLDRSVIRATAGLSGPYNFKPFAEDRLIFNMKPGDQAAPAAIEPVNYVDGSAPPMLLVQGGQDELIDPAANAIELERRICHAGGISKAIIYPDRGHESIVIALAAPWRWLAPVLHDSVAFFRKH